MNLRGASAALREMAAHPVGESLRWLAPGDQKHSIVLSSNSLACALANIGATAKAQVFVPRPFVSVTVCLCTWTDVC